VFGSFAPRGRDIVFGLGGRAEALRVAGRMRGRWIAFARGESPELPGAADRDTADRDSPDPDTTGPGIEPSVPWPPYDTEERPTLIIDREERVENDPDGEIREAWGPEILAFR
jgi:para-nitrobenzyl esterase